MTKGLILLRSDFTVFAIISLSTRSFSFSLHFIVICLGLLVPVCLGSLTVAVSLVVEVGEEEDEGDGVQEHGQVEALGKVTRPLEHVHTRVNDHSDKLTL